MTRNRDEFDERNAERAFAELGEGIETPSPEELRALARGATSTPRELPQPRTRARRFPLRARWTAAATAAALLVGSTLGFSLGSSSTGSGLPGGDFGAFVMADDAIAAPAAVLTRSCAPAGPFFNVHLIGNKEGSFWAQAFIHAELFSGIPPQTSLVSVWTFGNQASEGPVLYGWISERRSRFSTRCRARTARAPSRGDLGPIIRVKDGWATGALFKCDHRGRFVIQTEELGARTRMAVWSERSGELIAKAETRPGSAWAQVSKSCSRRNP